MKGLPLIIFVAALLTSCLSSDPAERGSISAYPKVEIAHIVEDSISIPVFSVGVLSSQMQSNLSFLTGGIIQSFYFSEGDVVEKGDVLVKLDMTEIHSKVQQASLAFEKAKRDFQRAENLYNDTVITLEQYQNARTAFEMAGTNYRIAQFNKKNSEITAPADGKILKKLKESNEVVGPGQPVLVFASTETDWILKVNLADKDIVRLSVGDSSLVTFDAYPGNNYHAVVSEIATAANLMSGTFEVELRLLELPERLVSGLIGQARIFPPKESFIFLPPEGLVEAVGNEGIVFILKEGKAIRKEIVVGPVNDRGIIIIKGLKAGEKVITHGNAWLKDGESVEVVEN